MYLPFLFMDIKLFSTVLKKNNFNYTIDYQIKQVNVDTIFQFREDSLRDSTVYLYLDSWNKVSQQFCWWTLKYQLVYIGSGLFISDKPSRPWCSRPTGHKKDFIKAFTEKYPGRLIICTVNDNLTENESRVLEAYMINAALDEYNYQLTGFNDYSLDLKSNQLINKKRGLKQPVLRAINLIKPMYLNGNYPWETTRR